MQKLFQKTKPTSVDAAPAAVSCEKIKKNNIGIETPDRQFEAQLMLYSNIKLALSYVSLAEVLSYSLE